MSVVSFISSWLKDIVVLFILISIAELIMPKGNMKRYINLVIGLLIIFTIVNPFAKLMKLDFNLDQAIFNYSKSDDYLNNDEEFYMQQEKQIESLYKEKISNEMIELVEDKTEYKVVDISIGIIESKEKYGEIDYIKLIVDKNKETKSNKISIEKVSPVYIDNNVKAISNKNSKDNDVNNDFNELKELLSSRYSIEKEKITVRGYEKGKGDINEWNIWKT